MATSSRVPAPVGITYSDSRSSMEKVQISDKLLKLHGSISGNRWDAPQPAPDANTERRWESSEEDVLQVGRSSQKRKRSEALPTPADRATPSSLVDAWRRRIECEMQLEARIQLPTTAHDIRRKAIDHKIGLRVLSDADSCEATMSSYFCLNYQEYTQDKKTREFVEWVRQSFPQIGIRILGPTLEDFAAIDPNIQCSNFQTQIVSELLSPKLAPSLDKIAQVIQRALIQAVHRVASVDYSFVPDCPGSTIVACSPQMTYRLTNPKILSFENMDPSLMKKIATKIADASKILSDPKQVAELVKDDSPVSHHLRSNVYSKNFS